MKGIPAGLVELDPEIAKKAIEGHTDVLAAEDKAAEALYRQHRDCPRGCGPTMRKSAAPAAWAFQDSNWHIPRCLMECQHCGCTKDPFGGLIVELGDPDTANAGAPVIKP
jgi:hypothetical protein